MLNDMVEMEKAILSYTDTFMVNSGRNLAKEIITDCLKKDLVENKMRKLRSKNLYDRSALEYYNKYGTVGEF
jgi:hypothetical protein